MPGEDDIEIAVKTAVTEWMQESYVVTGNPASGRKPMPKITSNSKIHKLAYNYGDSIDSIILPMKIPFVIEDEVSKRLGNKFELSGDAHEEISRRVRKCKSVRDLTLLVGQEVGKYAAGAAPT